MTDEKYPNRLRACLRESESRRGRDSPGTTSKDYGGKAFIVRDPEGHIWSIGEYIPWSTI
jgi:hypothetical protein